MANERAKIEGASCPFGVSWVQEDEAYNFAIYSKDAKEVSLLLYDGQNFLTPLAVVPFDLPGNRTGRVWHKRVPASVTTKAVYYAYRIDGPNTPQSGARFDPQKILLDPYACGVFFPPVIAGAPPVCPVRMQAWRPSAFCRRATGRSKIICLPPPGITMI